MSKGSKQRPTDLGRYAAEFDRIFKQNKEGKADAVQESERQKEADKRASRD
jgi:hypothetical protein